MGRWDDKDRVVHATALAGRLVIEKTRQGQPYSLKYAPPASPGDLSADYLPVGEARHDALGPYDLDLRASTIRNRGGSWLPARVVSGIEAEAEYLRLARVRVRRTMPRRQRRGQQKATSRRFNGNISALTKLPTPWPEDRGALRSIAPSTNVSCTTL
jgi:hypothetical protein